MPNWCYNRLQIVGKGTDVLAFVNDGIRAALAGKTSFEEKNEKITKELEKLSDVCVDTFPRFSSWLPLPSNFLELEKLGYHKGTNKELTDEVKALINKTIAECGTSDWSPNDEWVLSVGEKYPHLRFYLDYYEPGCCFDGGAVVEDGEYCECDVDEDWKEQFVWDDEEDEDDEEEVED